MLKRLETGSNLGDEKERGDTYCGREMLSRRLNGFQGTVAPAVAARWLSAMVSRAALPGTGRLS